MREKSLAVLLCMLTLLLSGRHLSPGSGAHLQSHGRDEPGSGKVDRGTDGHAPPPCPAARPAAVPPGPPSGAPPPLRGRRGRSLTRPLPLPPAAAPVQPQPPARSTGRSGEEGRKLCEPSVTEVTDVTGVSVLSEHASRAGC